MRQGLSSIAAFGLGSLVTAAMLLAPGNAIINGVSYPGAVVVQNGKSYVSAESLRTAGAQISSTPQGLSVGFVPLGGRNQVDAVEGDLQEWVQNDLWRVRVESFSPVPSPFGRGPGMRLRVEFRNLSPRPISPFNSGMDKLQVIDKAGKVLSVQQGSFKQYFNNIAPGGAAVEDIVFGDPQNAITELAEPEKLMIFFRQSGGKKAKDFRIFLQPKSAGSPD